MPPADHSVDQRRPTKAVQQAGVPPEHLQCPRCDSTSTKFCYYNNHNLAQPRYFCKSCRRYWTHGGTLRDIPIGGGTRKTAKRSRTSALDYRHLGTATPVLYHGGPSPFLGDGKHGGNNLYGSFTSMLNITHGFGMGVGSGFEGLGFGLEKTSWPFSGVGDGGVGAAAGGGGVMANTWLAMENGAGGEFAGGGGDCFLLPGLAISPPANAMK